MLFVSIIQWKLTVKPHSPLLCRLNTENGISVQQAGKLKDDKTFVVQGSYSYTGADGRRYRVRYTADEFGYHPKTELEIDLPE